MENDSAQLGQAGWRDRRLYLKICCYHCFPLCLDKLNEPCHPRFEKLARGELWAAGLRALLNPKRTLNCSLYRFIQAFLMVNKSECSRWQKPLLTARPNIQKVLEKGPKMSDWYQLSFPVCSVSRSEPRVMAPNSGAWIVSLASRGCRNEGNLLANLPHETPGDVRWRKMGVVHSEWIAVRKE